MTGNNVPQEMHTIHSQMKQLDANASELKLELSRAFGIITNLTAELNTMKQKMAKISDSVEAAPAIRQIPKELQDLQKVIQFIVFIRFMQTYPSIGCGRYWIANHNK